MPDLTRGFGTKFLHHLEKSKILIIVIDLSSRQNDSPIQQLNQINNVLNYFNNDLLSRKQILVVANKIDEPDALERLAELKSKTSQLIIPVSANKKINLIKFLKILREFYDKV
jgi:GTP-binding protein